jgi:hypothetical protein
VERFLSQLQAKEQQDWLAGTACTAPRRCHVGEAACLLPAVNSLFDLKWSERTVEGIGKLQWSIASWVS